MVAIACMIENKGAVFSGVGVARAGGPGLPRLHEPRARLGHPWPSDVASDLVASPGRHCHSTLSSTVIDWHSVGIYTVVLLSLLSFSAKMYVYSIRDSPYQIYSGWRQKTVLACVPRHGPARKARRAAQARCRLRCACHCL
jgi:hypothetical protein